MIDVVKQVSLDGLNMFSALVTCLNCGRSRYSSRLVGPADVLAPITSLSYLVHPRHRIVMMLYH